MQRTISERLSFKKHACDAGSPLRRPERAADFGDHDKGGVWWRRLHNKHFKQSTHTHNAHTKVKAIQFELDAKYIQSRVLRPTETCQRPLHTQSSPTSSSIRSVGVFGVTYLFKHDRHEVNAIIWRAGGWQRRRADIFAHRRAYAHRRTHTCRLEHQDSLTEI